MPKLFLASVAGRVLNKIIPRLDKKPSDLTVAFVPTAADNYDNKWFIDADYNDLKSAGFKITTLNFKNPAEQITTDILFVAGGNTFYLLDRVIKNNWDEKIKEFVAGGGIYIGSSAGSVLVGPDIETAAPFDDKNEAPDLKSTKGLGLVDFVVMPHYEPGEDFNQLNKNIKIYGQKYQIIPISNEQLVFVDNGGSVTI